MRKDTLYVGLDTDKRYVAIAVAEELPGGEARPVGRIANTAAALDKALKRLARPGRRLEVCYEAGPCGYGIHRRLSARSTSRCQPRPTSETVHHLLVQVSTFSLC